MTNNSIQIIADSSSGRNSNHGCFGPNISFAERHDFPVEATSPPPADDPRTIEWAEDWLHSEHAPEAAANDGFPTAVAIAITLREQGLSEPATEDLCHRWNYVGCSPSLPWAEIERAVHLAYHEPTIALALVSVKLPGPKTAEHPEPSERAAPAPPHPGAQPILAPSPA